MLALPGRRAGVQRRFSAQASGSQSLEHGVMLDCRWAHLLPTPPTGGSSQSRCQLSIGILGLIVCRDVDCVALRTSCLWRNDAARDEPAAPSGHRRVASGVQPRPARLSTGSTNKNGSSLISRQTRHRASRFPVRRTSTRAALLVLSSPDTGRAAFGTDTRHQPPLPLAKAWPEARGLLQPAAFCRTGRFQLLSVPLWAPKMSRLNRCVTHRHHDSSTSHLSTPPRAPDKRPFHSRRSISPLFAHKPLPPANWSCGRPSLCSCDTRPNTAQPPPNVGCPSISHGVQRKARGQHALGRPVHRQVEHHLSRCLSGDPIRQISR